MSDSNVLHRRGAQQLARALARKRQPLALATLSLGDKLYAMFGNKPAALAIAEYARGDLRNLQGQNLADLEGLPSVGKGMATKVAVLMQVMRDYR